MTTENVIELSADFLCAMVGFGDGKFRAADEALQAEKREREAKATHPWRANQPGQLQGAKPKPAKAPGRMK